MPADLTIPRDRLESLAAGEGVIRAFEAVELAQHALSEPTRIEAARQEGYRAGVEAAARWCRVQAYCAAIREQKAADEQARRAALLVKQTLDHAADVLPALSPLPAEPAQTDDGWIEWKGGECPVAPETIIEARLGSGAILRPQQAREAHWGRGRRVDPIIAYRIVKPAEPSAPVTPDWPTRCAALEADGISARKRVAALEAENAALREALRPFAEEADEWEGTNVRADDADPVFIGPDDVMETGKARFVVGDLRRARALLQGGPDAG